jgi:hypothetical protein
MRLRPNTTWQCAQGRTAGLEAWLTSQVYALLLEHVRSVSYLEEDRVSPRDYPPADSRMVLRLLHLAQLKENPATCPMRAMCAFPRFAESIVEFLECPQRILAPAHPLADMAGCKYCGVIVCSACQELGRSCRCGIMDFRRRGSSACDYADVDGVALTGEGGSDVHLH